MGRDQKRNKIPAFTGLSNRHNTIRVEAVHPPASYPGRNRRVRTAIRTDRTEKTERIKAELEKMVGYREAKQFSKKLGISDTTIRDIIEGKKTSVSYQSIDKLEVYINAINPEFEPSIENPMTKEKLVREEFDEISSELRQLSNGLMREAMEITEVARKMEAQQNYMGNEVHPARGLEISIEKLISLREQLTVLYETYIK